jgi:SMI1 / KNR4 family (SUKH-1)
MTDWKEFRRSVTVSGQRRFRPATDAELDAFEGHAGIPLPRSYREFSKVFGACEVGHKGIMIASPNLKKKRTNSELTYFADKVHEIIGGIVAEPPGIGLPPAIDPTQSLRMIFFGKDGKSSWFGFDPEDLLDGPDREYAVYSRYGGDDTPYTRRASSFEEFILGYCLDLDRWRAAGSPVGKVGFDFEPEDDHRLFITPISV